MRTSYQSYSADQWQQIMDHYHRSGLNQKTFCQQEGLAMSTFSKWRKQLGLVNNRPAVDTPADFRPLMSSPPLTVTAADEQPRDHGHWDIELTLGAGIILRLRTGV